MYEEILRMLKPHVANKVHCESLAERLADLFVEKIERAVAAENEEAYDAGYQDGVDDGRSDGQQEGYDEGYQVGYEEGKEDGAENPYC